ncbi:TIGR02679 family protein [Streptomyces sp. NPDC087420]|uniref:TIGR02679 family protein n=1 Tax=Streptomyces sp. NPDC087420 TaxID=3365785 RepID=UPI003835E0DE
MTLPAPERMAEPIRSYLCHPALRGLWTAVRTRLERNRLSPTGSVQVVLDEDGATQMGGLLGTICAPGRTRVKLEALDTALRASSARRGLLVAVADLTGAPLIDRAAAKETRDAAWTQVWQRLDASLGSAGLASAAWVPLWIAGIRSSGLLTRAGSIAADSALDHAVKTLSCLGLGSSLSGDSATRPWEIAELAAHITHDAHGLDDGTLTGALVLRAITAAGGGPPAENTAQRKALWESVKVTTDLVSGTVLTWRLMPPGDDPWSAMMRMRAKLGVATHLTMQELRSSSAAGIRLADPRQRIYACENPQILQGAARHGTDATLICTSGNPSSAGWELVRRLVHDDALVLYHGDFDWPGVGIAGRLFQAGARPWRMRAQDYLDALSLLPGDRTLPLTGEPAPTPWNPALADSMARQGYAVHEESQLGLLLADLGLPAAQ